MTNKTKTILCVCALTASAFAWNATAEGESTGTSYWPEGYDAAWFLYNPGTTYLKQTAFQAVTDDAVLSFAIERNNTENGFTFGTYTIDNGNIIKHTLGTVTDSGEVGKNGVEKITITSASGETKDFVNSGAFKANDLVGVWVQEIDSIDPTTGEITYKDLVYYSDNSLTIKEGANSQVVNSYVPYGTPNTDSDYVLKPDDIESAKAAWLADYKEKNPTVDPATVTPPDFTTFEYMQYTDSRIEGADFPVGATSLWFDDAWSYTKAINQYNNDKYNYGFPGLDANPSFIKIHVQGVAPASDGNTPGGPLPGVWATIALAGAASAYLKRRRKENK